jgi:hypothetical protein
LKTVEAARRKRNLENCLDGLSHCDPLLLSEQEATEVANAMHRRNVDSCMAGFATCDPSLLNGPEAAAVAAARQRNAAVK